MYRYKVSGIGAFPVDMLRYDCAWPADTESAVAICEHMRGERRTVTMHSARKPTDGRWASFLWRVSDVETYR